jgi:hypothetical protein
MRFRLVIVPLLFLVIFLSSCSINEDPRAMATTQISLVYDGERCQPYESFVPLGEEIEITLTNSSDYDFTWYLIFYPIEGKFEDQDSKNILASASASAHEDSTSRFIAPNLPARYDSLCIRDDDTDSRALTYLLVVQPYED